MHNLARSGPLVRSDSRRLVRALAAVVVGVADSGTGSGAGRAMIAAGMELESRYFGWKSLSGVSPFARLAAPGVPLHGRVVQADCD